jgi:hypothetical protein
MVPEADWRGLVGGAVLQALNQMFVVDPRSDGGAMFFVLPFFTYLALIPFLIAAFVFEHPRDD